MFTFSDKWDVEVVIIGLLGTNLMGGGENAVVTMTVDIDNVIMPSSNRQHASMLIIISRGWSLTMMAQILKTFATLTLHYPLNL